MNATIPTFEEIIHDLDSLYKVNRIGNSLDIVNDLTFKAPTAQEVIGKIEKLAKLVQGVQVTIHGQLVHVPVVFHGFILGVFLQVRLEVVPVLEFLLCEATEVVSVVLNEALVALLDHALFAALVVIGVAKLARFKFLDLVE